MGSFDVVVHTDTAVRSPVAGAPTVMPDQDTTDRNSTDRNDAWTNIVDLSHG